ncbi:GNAT family N-acetyltransferase [Fictibacillus nanhaiensis]|uniref:GNAT family N-acetyltransferase n=1 Tax=Fictibacillus nanhaiensis TaxID=742169 RepID=UPI001C97474F|nr:GNAT family N-acetyltransferase [Fictibacillus nanhaiensis]MBY6037629.1 GNAT family N-acetyltransferase [Fictibacillus nanhaiensis]
MELKYEILPIHQIELCRDLCNELMAFQQSKAYITPELFDTMNFDSRMIPSIKKAVANYIVVVKDEDQIVAYVYSNISPKEVYSNEFATFFDLNSVKEELVGCLSQFYIKKEYRQYGIGSKLFNLSIKWLNQFEDVEDYFIFVSNGNEDALEFYKRKGFSVSHDILDGFITVLRSKKLVNDNLKV